MRKLGFILLLIAVVLGCAPTTQKVAFHKIVGKDTIRTKMVLLKNNDVDLAYQKIAVRKVEASLSKVPIGFSIKSTLTGKEIDLVIVTRKEVQTIDSVSSSEIKEIGKKSKVDLVIVVELVDVKYKEGRTKKENQECVFKKADSILSAKVFETKKGKILLAGVYEGKYKFNKCFKGGVIEEEVPSKDRVVIRSIKKASSKFADEFWENL